MTRHVMRVRDVCKQAQFPIREAEDIARAIGVVLRGVSGSKYVTHADAKKLFSALQDEATRRREMRYPIVAREKFNEVYFIRCVDFVKIGFTYDVRARLETLQAATPYELELLDSFPGQEADEKSLHSRFADYRVRGEWFRLAPEILEYIECRRADRGKSPVKSPVSTEFDDEIRAALDAVFV